MKLTNFLTFTILFLIPEIAFSQQQFMPLGNFYEHEVSYEINKKNIAINTAFKPILKSDIIKIVKIDSVLYDFERKDKFFKKHKNNWFWRALMFDDFITVEKGNFDLYINPLFYVEYAKNNINTYNINTRGIELKGNIGRKISFYSSFRENQAKFRTYIYTWSWNRLVVPGQGALKKNNKNKENFDFSSSSAYLSYTPYNWLNIQIGQDKNFIGEGYRSLLLSDISSNYPFAKFSFTYKSFKYVTMFTEFQDFSGAYYDYHTKKHGTFNYLSYNYKNRFEIGLFEGVIYRTTDTSAGYSNKFKADFFIPIIGLRTGVNGFDSEDNVLAGINAKIKIIKKIQTYGQIAIDDPKQGKFAYQVGIKAFDLLHTYLKDANLYFQAEYNIAKPRTYSHKNIKYQTWSHYNQELAHPAGSDFKEFFVNATMHYKTFFVDFRYNNLTLNNKSTFSDIYSTDFNTYLSIAKPINITHNTITGGYILNKRTNLQFYASVDVRTKKISDFTEKNTFIMFGIKTGLNNFYYDF